MQSYEFNSVIEDKGIIRVPERYLPDISSPVRVVVFTNDEVQNSNKRKHFSAMKIKTKNFKFNRDEANE